jgi:3-dehydroquinate synthase
VVEAIKHGLVADAEYWEWIDRHLTAVLARDPAAIGALVRQSIEIKAAIVATDEYEHGRRAILNAGHTVGHALEWLTGYRLPHGDAVGLGLVIEARIAAGFGLAPAILATDLSDRLTRVGVPLDLPGPERDDELLAAMRRDKKARHGALRLALLRAPGVLARASEWTTEVPDDVVRQALGGHRRRPPGRSIHTISTPSNT